MKFHLTRIRLNAQGYELPGGHRYFGVGASLYRYSHDPDDLRQPAIEEEIRAHSRDHAKELVRKIYPNATFYN